MSGWTLCVDESGDFSKAGELGVVAGVMLPGPPDSRLHKDLQTAIASALPGVPWPPHAAELIRPASRLLAAAGMPRRARPADLAPLVDGLKTQLSGVDLHSHDQVRDLDNRLRAEHRSQWDQLRAAQASQDAELAQVVGSLLQRDAFVLVAAQIVDGTDEAPPPGGDIVRDPYVRLLRLVLERTAAVLWHDQRGVETVHALIASRTVKHRSMPLGLPFQARFQQEIIAEAQAIPLVAAEDPRRHSVQIVPHRGRTDYKRDDCPAGLVLADWFALRIRHTLDRPGGGRAGHDWLSMRRRLTGRLHGLPIQRRAASLADSAEPLPTVGWGGEARVRVLDAIKLREILPTGDLSPGWVQGATDPWVRAAAAGWSS